MTLLGLYVLLLAVLNFGPSQRMLTQMAATELSQLLGTRVAIGRVEVGLFNRIMLHDVRIEDRQRTDMLQAQLVTAKVELRSLLRRKPLSLRSVSLLDADVCLYQQRPDSATNFQFVIDAFSSKKSKGPSTLDLRINSLILRRVNISYNQRFKAATPGRFNPAHLGVTDVNANISLKRLSDRDVMLRVRSFALAEASGLRIRSLSFKLTATRTQARITDFELRLQHSLIKQRQMVFRYDLSRGFANLGTTLRASGDLDEAHVATSDIAPLVPALRKLDVEADLGAHYDITPARIGIDRLTLRTSDKSLRLMANASLQRQAGKVCGVKVTLKGLQADGAALAQWLAPFVDNKQLAEALPRLGHLDLNGAGYYDTGRGGATRLALRSDLGLLAAKAGWDEPHQRLTTEVRLTQLNPSVALANPDLPTLITAQAEGSLTFRNKQLASAQGQVDVPHLVWRQHTYADINLAGRYNGQVASLNLKSADPDARLTADASLTFTNRQLHAVKGQLDVSQLVPAALGIHTRYGQAAFAGQVEADLQGLHGASLASLPQGHLTVNHFTMTDGDGAPYHLNELNLQITPQGERGGQLQLTSDFADAQLTGPLQPAVARQAVGRLLNRALPGLWKERILPSTSPHGPQWQIAASVKRTDFFKRMLGVDLQLTSPVLAHGTIDGGAGRTALTVTTDGWQTGRQSFGPTSLYLNGQGEAYQLLVKTQKEFSGKVFDCLADLQTRGGSLLTRLSWRGQTALRYEGNFVSETRFDGDSLGHYPHNTTMDMHIRPGQFVLADTVWHIASGALSLKGRGLSISNFRLSHANQMLTADGHIAPGKNDSIVARLKNIDVDYILGLVDFHAVEFGGRATGVALFSQQAGSTEVSARLNIPQFTFNQGRMGAAYIIGSWSKADNRIRLDADMRLPRYKGKEAGTAVHGYVDLANKGLQLDIEARQTNLQFLRRYVDGIFDRFDGRATGDVRLYGPFKQLDFEGRVKADASAVIAATGVRYDVTGGDVLFAPGSFAFRGFQVSDGRGGTGEASGELRHTHLKRLNYDFALTANHLLCYDQPQSSGLPFYSTTTGSGRVKMSGQPGRFTADINLTPDAPTTLVYLMGGGEAVGASNEMIRFHALADEEEADSLHALNQPTATQPATAEKSDDEDDGAGTDVWLNFLINTTPAAQVKIVTDPRTGDAITVYGNGPIRATWHNKGDFEMYGTYTLTRGTYRLSLQDVIRKELTIVPGSTLTFSGNPLEADLGLKAKYTVSGVSLSDLNYGAGFSQKSVKVDCLLNIGGKARNPQIDFDLDLQGISEDEKQMVRQLIAIDEDMNRQVIYLLGIGRFYAANTDAPASSITTQQQSSAAMRSFLSSTLTGQLNSAISSVLGTDSHWSFGTNLAPGTLGWSDLEVEGLLQGRLLNDRLLINGNFGYRDRPTYTSNFIGDFDIRYLLNPRGSVSLRAYSETTDRYFTKSSMTTQGIGLTLQKDFNRFTDLFWWRKKARIRVPFVPTTSGDGDK